MTSDSVRIPFCYLQLQVLAVFQTLVLAVLMLTSSSLSAALLVLIIAFLGAWPFLVPPAWQKRILSLASSLPSLLPTAPGRGNDTLEAPGVSGIDFISRIPPHDLSNCSRAIYTNCSIFSCVRVISMVM